MLFYLFSIFCPFISRKWIWIIQVNARFKSQLIAIQMTVTKTKTNTKLTDTHTHTQTRTKPNQNYNKKPTHSLESICKIYRKATIFSRYAIFTFCHFNNLFNLISITFIFRPFLFVAHSVFLSRSAFFNLNINFRCYIFFKNDPKHIFLSIVTRFRFNSHQYRHSMCGVVWFRVRSIHRQSLSWRYTLWLPDKQNSFYLFITSIWPGTRKAPSET